MPDHASVFEAEMQALNLAVETLSRMKMKGRVINIHSDSMSSLMALANSKITSTLVSRTKFKLNNLGRSNRLSLWWVKAHVGNPGNELADDLAKAGSAMLGPTRFAIKPKVSSMNQKVDDHFIKMWLKRWKHPSCRQTKIWFPDRKPDKSSNLLNLGRITLGECVKFITGFNYLAYHQHNIGTLDTNLCRLCQTDREEARHLTDDCPAVIGLRLRTFGPFGVTNLWSINSLLSFIKDPKIADLITDPTQDT